MTKQTIAPLPQYPEILIALDLMSATPAKFHWFLYVPDSPQTGSAAGTKLHAVTNGLQGDDKKWSYDRTEFDLSISPAVAAAAVIGRLPEGRTVDDLDMLLQKIPMSTPDMDKAREPAWTCRVWIREALRRMHANAWIVCEDVDAMEAEMWRHGKEAAAAIDADTFTMAMLHSAAHSRPV
ncbi:hypothetical protein K466DRAFT_587586 [Polyporus arcularius HHB13444]|uniref:Uncharacterized protein n=1 Tax=Polyporus arcularius HHB13444 TaxID=1314778 RepID=A0A5C3PCV1_9APHY|nr:hypothetical protein K466DRAFT_587586 [Polyporus arcularius HHB13444]